MKKPILIVGLVMGALALFGVGVAFAQGSIPYAGNGPIMQGGGLLHAYMVAAFAEKLDLGVEDVNARILAGETMYDIAIAEGVHPEQLPALMTEVRSSALNAAVKDGVITQEQADWMSSHGFGRGGRGPGNCPMQNGQGARFDPQSGFGPGMMGNWQNQQTDP
jgi:hypothetical protein